MVDADFVKSVFVRFVDTPTSLTYIPMHLREHYSELIGEFYHFVGQVENEMFDIFKDAFDDTNLSCPNAIITYVDGQVNMSPTTKTLATRFYEGQGTFVLYLASVYADTAPPEAFDLESYESANAPLV